MRTDNTGQGKAKEMFQFIEQKRVITESKAFFYVEGEGGNVTW